MSDKKKQNNSENLEEILKEVENLKEKESKEADQKKDVTKNVLEEKISQLESEISQKQEQFLRVNADMQNIRRRSDEARMKARYDGAVDAITPFLETIDLLKKAVENIPKDIKDSSFVIGIISAEKKFSDSLSKIGIEFFGTKGEEFDENKHDSMMISPDAEKGVIAQVFEQGILFRGKTLRHAKVSVGG